MDLMRIAKHLLLADRQLRRAFPAAVLTQIEQAVRRAESLHAGQICFVVEGGLDPQSLWRGQLARERAIEVFSQLRIWDTEHNNGVLAYVLLADRAVEIIVDRGIHAKAEAGVWEEICRAMEYAFRRGQYAEGVQAGVQAVAAQLGRCFPMSAPGLNELPDRPLRLERQARRGQ
ncbi:MAG TPA: TPM domain-containing protein [Pseudoduganella sp.]